MILPSMGGVKKLLIKKEYTECQEQQSYYFWALLNAK